MGGLCRSIAFDAQGGGQTAYVFWMTMLGNLAE